MAAHPYSCYLLPILAFPLFPHLTFQLDWRCPQSGRTRTPPPPRAVPQSENFCFRPSRFEATPTPASPLADYFNRYNNSVCNALKAKKNLPPLTNVYFRSVFGLFIVVVFPPAETPLVRLSLSAGMGKPWKNF